MGTLFMSWFDFFFCGVEAFLILVFYLIICVIVEEIKKKIKDKKNRRMKHDKWNS